MAMMAITCNGSAPPNIYPVFILASSAVASGDDVVLFFTPGAAPALVKGEMEKIQDLKGYPNLIELYNGVVELGAKIYACEIALDAKDLKKEDFREGVEIIGATTFVNEITDATITFSF
jgi:predicted peroxiredoxin